MNRPNIIFILTDDQGAWALGRETPEIITPNIDKLADEGVYFRNFFCASPVCSPARCSIVTGRLPSAHGVHDWLRSGNVDINAVPPAMRPFLPDDRVAVDYLAGMPSVFDALRTAGYKLGLVGKWHMGDSMRPREGFDEWTVLLRGGCQYKHADVCIDGQPQFITQYVTDFFTDNAVRFIDEHPAEPFLLSLHYTAPHTPWGHEQHREDILRRYDDCPFSCHPFQPVHPDQVGTCEVGDTEERRRYRAVYCGLCRRLGELNREMNSALHQVSRSLGEMRDLASGGDDLKKVLSNVLTLNVIIGILFYRSSSGRARWSTTSSATTTSCPRCATG